MSNKDIVLWVYDNVDVEKFIRKVIDISYNNASYKDLSQYIYLYLLEYDNTKLNNLYDNKVLPQFIMRIILNQRNYYRSYFNLYLYPIDKELDFDKEYEIDIVDDKNDKLIFINKELKKYIGRRKNLSLSNEQEMLCYEVYRLYLNRGYTIKELSIRLDLGYNTVVRLIRTAKETIKNKYDKK